MNYEYELTMPEEVVRVAPGGDSEVFRDKNRTVVWKRYNQTLVTLSTITKYQDLTRQAQRFIRRLPTASFRFNDHSFTIRVDAITPILSIGVDPATHLIITTSPYVPGPNVEMLESDFRFQRNPFVFNELPKEEQERLTVFYPDSGPLFSQLSRYNVKLNCALRESISEYPGHVILMNEKIRMPDPATLALTITDLCAEVHWLK